jgi:hypothetical protein
MGKTQNHPLGVVKKLPTDLGFIQTERPLSNVELVRLQLERISRIRIDLTDQFRVERWSEAVEALADSLVPYWDADFKSEWVARRIGCYTGSDGELIPAPTVDEARSHQLIVMRLLDRKNLLTKRTGVSGP